MPPRVVIPESLDQLSSAPAQHAGKSAFAQEMEDLHVLTEECDAGSLVMLDEIGRGTSTREGAALGVSLLEWLDARASRLHCSKLPGSGKPHRRSA